MRSTWSAVCNLTGWAHCLFGRSFCSLSSQDAGRSSWHEQKNTQKSGENLVSSVDTTFSRLSSPTGCRTRHVPRPV
eukprot:2046476-Prymnesium_polylepis.1